MSSIDLSKNEPAVDLFFAFIDGAYDYVCSECTALCCKGHGFAGSLEREMGTLFARYPQLEAMALSRNGDEIIFAAPSSGCVMLDRDNLCRIEKELGKDKKPNICNLFPFNYFSQVGKTIVVRPHFLCPLRASVPPRPGQVQGTHALVAAGIRQSRMLNRDYVKSAIPPTRLHASVSATETIERESVFRDLCAQALGRTRFSEVLVAASSEPAALKTFSDRALRVMGCESILKSDKRDTLDDLLLVFASPYRIGFLDLESEEILRVLLVAEAIVRRAWPDGTQTATLQGLANTVSVFRPIQLLLAAGAQHFEFGRLTQKSFSFRNAELTFAAFMTVQQSPQQGVLTALEAAIPTSMSVADRSVLLMRLGELMQSTMSKRKPKTRATVEKILSLQDSKPVSEGLPSAAAMRILRGVH
jgi:hypothetical protein